MPTLQKTAVKFFLSLSVMGNYDKKMSSPNMCSTLKAVQFERLNLAQANFWL
jgi:hypothetical protein